MQFFETETPRYMEMGYRTVKIRVGRHSRQGRERVQGVRQIIGPGARFMLDFNFSPTCRGSVTGAYRIPIAGHAAKHTHAYNITASSGNLTVEVFRPPKQGGAATTTAQSDRKRMT